MIQLKGCSTALLTPFRDGKVDFEAYRASVQRQSKAGVDFLTALATTGETPTLSAEEKLELLRITRQAAPSLPILAGCGSNSLDATIPPARAPQARCLPGRGAFLQQAHAGGSVPLLQGSERIDGHTYSNI